MNLLTGKNSVVATLGVQFCPWRDLLPYYDQNPTATDFLSRGIKDPATGTSVLHTLKAGFIQQAEHCRCLVCVLELNSQLNYFLRRRIKSFFEK